MAFGGLEDVYIPQVTVKLGFLIHGTPKNISFVEKIGENTYKLIFDVTTFDTSLSSLEKTIKYTVIKNDDSYEVYEN